MKTKINNLIWEIITVPCTNPALIVNGANCLGTTWINEQKIYLSEELTKITAKSVVIHELTHAFLYSTQIKEDESYTEEEMCEFLSKWGEQILCLSAEVYSELF